MDNAEEILQALEEFTKLKPKDIPKELDEYLGYVARTGDPVYQWHLVKHLFHEKLSIVIKDFYETSPTIDLPPCPNVDPFNYERLRTSLLERLDMFSSAPFTVQRICELLTSPRKQYNRVDKFMRAIEKNILVVSTREPGVGKRLENEQPETVLNGIPDNKFNETEDRIINVCSDNLQFNNSDDSTQIPVVLHACIIQEEIEIANSLSASATVITTETKTWCDSENGKDSDLDVKTDVSDNSEINVVSTSSTSLQNSELPKNSNILFTENEMKDDSIDHVTKSTSDSMLCNEPIGSSTPDSPDSPEPSSSEELCTIDNLDDESVHPETTENEDVSSAKEEDNSEITKDVTETETDAIGNTAETVKELSSSTEDSNVADSSHVEEEEIDTPIIEEPVSEQEVKPEVSSPEQNQPDSSNDSYQNNSVDSKESSVEAQDGNVLQNDDATNESELSTSELNSTEVPDVTSSEVSVIQEDDETTSGDVIVKEIEEVSSRDEVVEDSEKTEESNCPLIEEAEGTDVTNEETVSSANDCDSVQEIAEVKEHIEDAVIAETSENVEKSSTEVLEGVSEEQERKEGSVIHATPSVSASESEPQTTTVEDICVDQTSCSTEDEAMDVDESSNQQMITSEGENEAEPMDESDAQSQS